jgi:phosphoenolpyruvate-protein phosphotransferase (PTS system enzyme I)
VLVGLGVTSLSMSARSIADVGAVLASVTLDGCRELAQLALSAADAQTAREVVRRGLPVLADLGL